MSIKKRWIRILSSAVGALALLAIAWTAWNVQSTARLRAAIDRASARGLPVRFDEIAEYLDARYEPVRSNANGAPLLLAAYQVLEDVVPPELEEPIPRVTEELREYVRQAEPALTLIAQGLERDRCRYHANWADEVAVRFPEVWGGAHASDALLSVAAIRLAEGDVAGALDQARLLSGLARTYEEHPTVIGQMVRITMARRSIDVLRATLPLSGDPLAAWRSGAPPSAGGSIATGLVGEMSFVSYGLSVVGGAKGFYGLDDPGLFGRLLARLTWPSERAAGAELLEVYLGVIEDGARPYPQRMARVAESLERLSDGSETFKAMSVPLGSLIAAEAEAVSLAAVTEAGVRILAFRRLHGRWPSQLDEVPGIPADARTAKSLEMRVEGDVLVIEAPGGVGAWRLE